MKAWVWALLPAAAAGCGGPAVGRDARIVAVPVTTALVSRASLRTQREFSGTLSAPHTVTVGAATGGRITALNVRIGDRVFAGETLAQIDTVQYRAQLSQAQAGAASAQQNTAAAQAAGTAAQSRLLLAESTAKRMEFLYAQGAISALQHDQAEADLAAARAAAQQAAAAAGAAGSSAAQAQAVAAAAAVPLRQSTIAAPFSAIVTQTFVDAGAVVGAGSPVVALEGTGDLELDVPVPEDLVRELSAGASVLVRVDALGGLTMPGRIRAIVPGQNSALHTLTLKIAVPSRPDLFSGMFARIEIHHRTPSTQVVPAQAVVTRAGQSGVFVVNGGVATFRPVTTGASDGNIVSVQGALGAGSRVAISNLQRLDDGTPVTVRH